MIPAVLQSFPWILYKTDTFLKWIITVFQSVSLTLYKTDTILKWTPRVAPAVFQSFSLTLYKTDTIFKWTPRDGPCRPSVIFFNPLQNRHHFKVDT